MGEISEQLALLPAWLQYWLRWMQVILILCPLLFIRYREAQIILLAQMLNFVVAAYVLSVQDYQITKLFGLGHVFWVLAYLAILARYLRKKIEFEGRALYSGWLLVAMLTMTVSLPLDAYDLFVYWQGMRLPIVEYYN